MRHDLELFNRLLRQWPKFDGSLLMPRCAKCQNTRVKGGAGKMIPASEWPEELDCIGLCDVHYTKRGQIKKKNDVKKRVDKSKPEAQIAGQMGLFPVKKGGG